MHNKAKQIVIMISAFALLTVGAVKTTSVATVDEASTVPVSGVSAVLSADENSSAVAGVSDVLIQTVSTGTDTESTESEESAEPQIDETGVAQAGSDYGYTHLGICQVEGNLNIRESASTDSSMVGKLPNNAACEILSTTEDGWYQITSGEISGYVSSEFIVTGAEAEAIAAEQMSTSAYVNTDNLRLRTEPSTESEIVAEVSNGTALELIEDLGEWLHVSIDSDEGYVSAEYVTLNTGLPTAITMTEARYGIGVSDVRVDLVEYALQFVGNPYVWGGTSLTNGADCSGFVLSIYAKYGYSLPHYSGAQANCGTRISASEAQPGDLFFYGGGSISHVAIYIGNGQIVHASSPKTGIIVSSAYYRTPICVTRILPD